MKGSRIATALAIAVTFATSGLTQAGGLKAGEKITSNTPDWEISVSALALQRSKPGGGAIVSGVGTPFMSASAFDFGWSPGIDASIAWRVFGDETIEARAMYSKMDAEHSFTSPGAFIGVGFTGPSGTLFNSEYETRLMSWEVNWRHDFNDHFSMLAGFRSLGVKDGMSTVLNANVASGRYGADNNMLGGQIGAQWSVFDRSNPFQLEVLGKFGVFSNRSEAGIKEYSGSNFIGGFQSGSVRETSYAAELGVTAGYKIFDNVTVAGGYQMLWVNNLALASNAAGGSLLDPALLLTNVYRDDVVFHGFNVGLKVAF